jgi:zinc transport system substrate-binding protein
MKRTALLTTLLAASVAPAQAGASIPSVITDIPAVESLTAQVMGDLGQPTLLLDRGADAHSFQLRPSQTRELAEADLVIWIGPGMTPWLDRALTGLAPDASQLRLLDAPGTIHRSFEEAGDHGHGHDHDHDHGPTDPHAWLSPANAQTWLALIAAELARLDPANAAAYQQNATRAAADIAVLDAKLQATLAPVTDIPFVVFHDAYGYFADHYGLTIAGTVALGDAAAPGAAHLAALRDRMAGAACIFPEAQHDPKLVETLAADTGIRLGGALDPEGATQPPGPQAYGAILSGLAQTITECLSQG